MLLVLSITNLFLGGEMLRFGGAGPDKLSAGLIGVNNSENQPMGQKEPEEEDIKELGKLIASQSCKFVKAAFDRDKAKVVDMLSEDAEYIVSGDNSSYLRYTAPDLHVEGYMATDRKLVQVRQNWYIIEDDGTITSEVEVSIEGEDAPQSGKYSCWKVECKREAEVWRYIN
jgi:hypothetical protein